MTTSPDTADALWSFSLALYGRPGVPALCLDLQDAHGADVNVVLALLFAGTRGVSLGADGVAALDAAVRPWREDVVVALRRVRRDLKGQGEEAEALRTTVKGAELAAEKIEQRRLAAGLGPVPAVAPPAVADTAMASNLDHYLAPRHAAAKARPFLDEVAALRTAARSGA